MMTLRREFVGGLAISLLNATTSLSQAHANQPSVNEFDAALEDALSTNTVAIQIAAADREGLLIQLQLFAARPLVGRSKRATRTISDRAIKLLTRFEITSAAYYKQKLESPIWPGGASGPTIGIGYDIGYVTPAWLAEDWRGFITDSDIEILSSGCGVTGTAARELTSTLSGVKVPWEAAERQFLQVILPMYITQTIEALPNAHELSNDSLGALVSLVYNRGPSFRFVSPRYREMRQIRLNMVTRNFADIPTQLLSMKRLWGQELSGLWARRELEAQLFQLGLG